MKIISLGAGVQSSAMLLMALEGRFGDKPDCAIFADTQWEPKAVYEWLERLEREVAPFPIHRLTVGNIRENTVQGVIPSSGRPTRYAALPFHLRSFADGSEGMGKRQCSQEYKIAPMRRFIVRTLGVRTYESWIGISLDEAIRMKPSRWKRVLNRYPLIDIRYRREDCQNYLISRLGVGAPKSSCIGCPFHGDEYWAQMRAHSPEEFADAIEFDRLLRSGGGRMKSDLYVHRSLIPLGDIKEFRHEKQGRMFLDGFGNECEGVCGT